MKSEIAWEKGSFTVEAAVMLPVFIIVFVIFTFLIKVYYVNEIIQHAITGACSEISAYSLLYYETNADEISGAIEKICNSEGINDSSSDNSLRMYINTLGKNASDYLRAQSAMVPLTKILVKRNLGFNCCEGVNERLKSLHLKDGFENLDFSESRMLADGKSIEIAVNYKISFPFFSNLFSGIKVRQVAASCIWAGEAGVNNNEAARSVWNLDNISRGRKIRELQGANLPYFFPTIANFQNGTATSIKSLNICKAYYNSSSNLKKKLLQYIDKLETFECGESSGVKIEVRNISGKELRLIIPEAELLQNQQNTLDECTLIARRKGIYMNIIKAYGKPDTSPTEENEQDD
jgi:hypothetical protein